MHAIFVRWWEELNPTLESNPRLPCRRFVSIFNIYTIAVQQEAHFLLKTGIRVVLVHVFGAEVIQTNTKK